MKKITWKIEKRKIADLKPAGYNPRRLTEKQREELTKSIQEFGQVEPVVINLDGTVIGGHQRIKIYADLEIENCDAMKPSRQLKKKEEKELNLRLNRNTGDWDWEKLKAEFDIEELMNVGFDEEELSYLWDDVTTLDDDNFDFDKTIAEIQKTSIKPGDLFRLGNHKLLCGDATKLEDAKKLMDLGKVPVLADIVYCDPPYNIGLDYARGVSLGRNKYSANQRKNTKGKFPDLKFKSFGVNDRKKIEDYKKFLTETIKNAIIFSKPSAHFFYWCDENYIYLLQEIYKEVGISHRRVCLWIKNNFTLTPQFAFNKVYEACVYGTRGKPYLNSHYKNINEILNREVESGTQVIDEILEMINLWIAKRDAGQEYIHPTQKPIILHEKPLKRCSKPGDIIIDFFGGSGSTLIACEQLKRKCFMMEKDPIFCEGIIKRFEAFTNVKTKQLN